MNPHPDTGDWSAPPAAGPADWPAIPGYEILQELGRGGMGVVYKARQLSFQRLVALKMMRDSALASPQDQARFRIEVQAAARMRHPHIVEIYEIGQHAGRPYFAMELVCGNSLDKHLSGQPMAAAQAGALARTLALAVQHAHDQRIVHRDLKPANILLAEVQRPEQPAQPQSGWSRWEPKIVDFGLAKRLDTDSSAWTREGAIVGTASYMSPEQADGRVREIGPAADLYALGCILYELLTGAPPFRADSWNEMIRQVVCEEPVPPSRRQADIPHDLEVICLKCLEKDPGRRYASATDLADDLGRFLAGRPIAAQPPSVTERLVRLAERDGYQILAEIGRGLRSVVYQARYGPLQQPTALKVFMAGACRREQWEVQMRQTAELWAALAHPNLVPVHRAGWWDESLYLAMEYVPHGSLVARIGGQPYPVRQAVQLVEKLTEIVAYLHRQGIIHGNLKPTNVLLAPDGIPRLADFRLGSGLVPGPLSADAEQGARLAYLAPEQVQNPAAECRPYTDVYGLGTILYELLTGRPPFGGLSSLEVVEQIRSQDPVPPSRLNPAVTPYVEKWCLRCLKKNPFKRYARVYDLGRRLRYFLDNPDAMEMLDRRRSRSAWVEHDDRNDLPDGRSPERI